MDIFAKHTAHSHLVTPSWISELANDLQARVRELAKRRQLKQEMGQLSATALRDIGLTEADLEKMNGLPVDDNCEQRLAKTKRMRAGNW